ncbi:hypothetical protein ACQKMV_05755 [Lysinibacillus sp. NPDC094403]|uniref:hypothetical protein n=1 Tax=Lysinibacillus sp. NPDC094403 TaxID=3390581 RepID=UPI003D02528D
MINKGIAISGAKMKINELQADLNVHKKNLKFAEYVIENGIMNVSFVPVERSQKAIEKIEREIDKYEKQIERLKREIEIEKVIK